MIYLYDLQKITDTDYIVGGQHNVPFHPVYGLGKTKEQLEADGGIFVNELPQRDHIPGKVPVLHINPQTKELWYEYVDEKTPLTDDVNALKNQIQLMQQALDDLLLGGM
jgi:hypothetical protein